MSWFFLAAGFIVLLFFGSFSLFGYFAGSMFIFWFILGFAIFCFLLMFTLFIVFRVIGKRREKEVELEPIYHPKTQPSAINDPYIRKKEAPSTGLFGRLFSPRTVQTQPIETPQSQLVQSEPIVIYNIQPITKAPPGSKCMISKLDMKPEDNVVQCVNCHSYFIKDYIVEWLKNHENCPVCQTILRMD
ncbi:MAG: hypothetical protein FK733_15340 [Asgard group archaeon]|nr:hypothetical protein [Asgard group archaeon]